MSKTVEFQSTRSPAHHVAVTGSKFVGGTLIVDEAIAPAIRAYAARYPHFGIREIVAAAPKPAPAPIVEAATPRRRPARPHNAPSPPAAPAIDPEPTEPDPVAPGPSYAEGGLVAEATFAEVAAGEVIIPAATDPEAEVESA